MLEDLKHHSKTVGTKQTVKALEASMVQTVYIAKDADERVVSKILEVCRGKNIPIYRADNMKMLGKACGIDVGTAVAAVLNEE